MSNYIFLLLNIVLLGLNAFFVYGLWKWRDRAYNIAHKQLEEFYENRANKLFEAKFYSNAHCFKESFMDVTAREAIRKSVKDEVEKIKSLSQNGITPGLNYLVEQIITNEVCKYVQNKELSNDQPN